MHGACAAEFTNGSMCHYAEYLFANSTAIIGSEGAWIDASEDEVGDFTNSGGATFGRRTASSSCNYWTHSAAGTYAGYSLRSDGALITDSCNETKPIACCNGVARVSFAGFTATSYDGGSSGGRAARHGLCDSEFVGSHMCHFAEYLRTRSTTAVPNSGAWLDASSAPDGSFSNGGIPAAGRRTSSSSCNYWTHSTAGTHAGYSLRSPGAALITAGCDEMKPIACCYGP